MKKDMKKGSKVKETTPLDLLVARIGNDVRETVVREVNAQVKETTQRAEQLKKRLDALKISSTKVLDLEVRRKLDAEKQLTEALDRIAVLEKRLEDQSNIETVVEKIEEKAEATS